MKTTKYKIILPSGITVYSEGTDIEIKDGFIQVFENDSGVIKTVIAIYPQGSACFPITNEDITSKIEGLRDASLRMFSVFTDPYDSFGSGEKSVIKKEFKTYIENL